MFSLNITHTVAAQLVFNILGLHIHFEIFFFLLDLLLFFIMTNENVDLSVTQLKALQIFIKGLTIYIVQHLDFLTLESG